MLDLLTGLVEKSLVVYMPNEDRYRLLETIRQHLVDRLKENEDGTVIADKHLSYFLNLAETAEPELKGPRQTAWLNRLEAEHDNLRTALSWSRSAHGNPEYGVRLAGALHRFWMGRGFLAEGRQQVALSLAAGSTKATAYRAKALNGGGLLAYRQSDLITARSLYGESLEIARKIGDLTRIASVLSNLGAIDMEQGKLESARSLYDESLAINRELGSQWGIAVCLYHLGTAALKRGDLDTAGEVYEEGLAISREIGDNSLTAYMIARLGLISYYKCDFLGACSLHEESLAMRREMGDRQLISASLFLLGQSKLELGDYDTARSFLIESLEIRRDLGERAGIANTLEAFADLANRTANPESGWRAPRLFGAVEALGESIGIPVWPNERERYLRGVARTRKALDEESFKIAWAEGRAMSMEQAIAYALSEWAPETIA